MTKKIIKLIKKNKNCKGIIIKNFSSQFKFSKSHNVHIESLENLKQNSYNKDQKESYTLQDLLNT